MMLPTPYFDLNQVLFDLVKRIQLILEDEFTGAYLQGSFAVGDYDQHSDVDFIIAIENELTPYQVDALQIMHGQIYQLDSGWAQHLEGSYFPREILRHHSKRRMKLWYLDNGARSLIQSDHCNTSLVRWIVREKGVALAGPPPETLVEPLSADALRAEIFETITNWGMEILDDPAHYKNRFYQAYIALNYCRMLHDLYRGYPGSKREGAEWAKAFLDPMWSDLIDSTWDGRPNPARKVKEPADPQAFERTLKFVAYIMDESKLFMVHNQNNPGKAKK